MNKIMVIAPHPDDETLGCGGTLLKHKHNGDEIYWLIMTNVSTTNGYDEKRCITRQEEIEKVKKEYGFQDIYKLDFPTAKLDTLDTSYIIDEVSNVINIVKPQIIYSPYKNDVHTDHKITFDVVISSTKSFRCPFLEKILMYEVLSETDFSPPEENNVFSPNVFSDISDFINKKLHIMKIYKSELGSPPFPRSIENIKALATFRGSTAGVRYAESFMLIKEVI